MSGFIEWNGTTERGLSAFHWDGVSEHGLTVAGSVTNEPPTGGDGYVEGWGYPVWEDDFDGANGAPDSTKWYRRGLPGSDYYLSGTDRQGIIVADNCYVENGNLVIKTERRTSPLTPDAYTRWYNTGYLDTMPRSGFAGFEQRYGRWEVRVHSLVPADNGLPASAGMWSAFWLRTRQDGGEVDVFEHYGTPAGMDEDGTSGSYAYSSFWPPSGAGSQTVFFEQTGQTSNNAGEAFHQVRYNLPAPYYGWHTYACEWTPDRISVYCDGTLVGEVRRGVKANNNLLDGALILDGGFGGSAKAHIRMDVHVGSPNIGMASEANTLSPHFTYFDYVRVWEWTGQA